MQTKPTSENYFYKGLDAYSHKDYSKAITYFKETADDPKNTFFLNALYLLATSYENIKEYKQAISTYDKLLKYSLNLETPSEILYKIAQVYKKMGDSRYIEKLKALVEKYHYSSYADIAKYELGNINFEAKKYNDAVIYYTSINKDSGLYPLGMLQAAYIFYLGKNYAQSAYLYYLVDLNKIDSAKYSKQIAAAADVFCYMKDFKSANNVLSILSNNKIPQYYTAKARCEILSKNLNLAQNTLKEALNKYPNSQDVKQLNTKLTLTTQNLTTKQLESIVEQYKNNSEIAPLAIYLYALKQLNNKKYNSVLNAYAKIIHFDSSYIEKTQLLAIKALNALADVYALAYDEKGMYSVLRHANDLKLSINSCELAKAFMFLEKYKQAQSVIKKGCECYYIISANQLLDKGEVNKATSKIGNIKEKNYLNLIFAKMAYLSGDYQKASSFFEVCAKSKDPLLSQYAKIQIANIKLQNSKLKTPLILSDFKPPFIPQVRFINAMYYFNKKDYKKALKHFAAIENLKKYNERSLFYETLCFFYLGQKKAALSKLSILQENYPDSQLAKRLSVLLK